MYRSQEEMVVSANKVSLALRRPVVCNVNKDKNTKMAYVKTVLRVLTALKIREFKKNVQKVHMETRQAWTRKLNARSAPMANTATRRNKHQTLVKTVRKGITATRRNR